MGMSILKARYPGPDEPVSEEEYNKALQIAETVISLGWSLNSIVNIHAVK